MSTLIVMIAKFGGPLGIVLAFSYFVIYGRAKGDREPRLSQGKKYLLLLALFTFVLVTIAGWSSKESKSVPAEITIQSTSGANSPAISGVKGNVNILQGNIPKVEEKPAPKETAK